MGTQIAIPIEEYLRTTHPGTDREYRNGEVVERPMPVFSHGECQMLIGAFFTARRFRYHLYACSETRMRLPGNRVLIADVAVFHPVRSPLEFPDTAPLIAIEILSPDDRTSEVRAKLQEYIAWDVRHVWLVDPQSHRMYRCADKLIEVDRLSIDELELEPTPSDIFN